MQTGYLDIITGPMFSGKSTELLRRLLVEVSVGRNVLYINHSSDTRGSIDKETPAPFSTHNPLLSKGEMTKFPPNITFKSSSELKSLEFFIQDFDIIGIDEAQFFSDLHIAVTYFVDNLNKHIVVSGLTGDSDRKKFGQILDLEPFCDTYTKLSSRCSMCDPSLKINANFTYKKLLSANIVEIGGAELYTPLCRKCYLARVE